MGTAVIRVVEQGADAERVEAITRALRADLRDLDMVEVDVLREEAVPPGARGIDVAVVGALVASTAELVTVLPALIEVVRAWLRRSPVAGRSVTIEIDGDSLQLTDASREQEERLVEFFLARHDRVNGR